MKLLFSLATAGAVHTNSTDEAVLGSYEFPAYFWQPGKVIKGRALARVLDSNSTDTLTIRLRFGAVALTGTAVVTTAAIDSADNDLALVEFELSCRDADDDSTIVATALANDPDATGTAAKAYGEILSSVDTTASTYIAITADWSVAHADNQVQLESLTLFEAV